MCPIEVAFPFNHPAFFVKKSVYEKYGLFREDLRLAMDFEFVSRFYRSPQDCDLKVEYIPNMPLTIMYAGGASWTHELRTLKECEKVLREKGIWNRLAMYHLASRRFRIRIKGMLNNIGVLGPISTWRKLKWD